MERRITSTLKTQQSGGHGAEDAQGGSHEDHDIMGAMRMIPPYALSDLTLHRYRQTTFAS